MARSVTNRCHTQKTWRRRIEIPLDPVKRQDYDGFMNTTQPIRPDESIDEAEEAVVRERLATFDRDKDTTLSREEAKKRIFSQPVPR
jgi:hypothetical protein